MTARCLLWIEVSYDDCMFVLPSLFHMADWHVMKVVIQTDVRINFLLFLPLFTSSYARSHA